MYEANIHTDIARVSGRGTSDIIFSPAKRNDVIKIIEIIEFLVEENSSCIANADQRPFVLKLGMLEGHTMLSYFHNTE